MFRRMDRVYWNIRRLGDFIEEISSASCNTIPHNSQKGTNHENMLPPPDKETDENKVDIVGRLFGGTVRDRKLKNLTLDENEKITRRTTGVKRNNFITRVFEIYFNLHTNH